MWSWVVYDCGVIATETLQRLKGTHFGWGDVVAKESVRARQKRYFSGPSAPIQSGPKDKLKPLGFGADYVVALRALLRREGQSQTGSQVELKPRPTKIPDFPRTS